MGGGRRVAGWPRGPPPLREGAIATEETGRSRGLAWVVVPLLAVVLPLASAALFDARSRHVNDGEVVPPLDDTYIYLQYARAFAEGAPWAWLPGEGYTTGATSMLYVPMIAAGHALGARGSSLYLVAWGLGLAAFAVALWRLGAWLRREYALLPAVAGVLAAAGSGVVLWTVHAGMDGALLLLALVVLAERARTAAAAQREPGPFTTLLFALMPLVRPEAGAIALAVGAWVAFARGRGHRLPTATRLIGAPVVVAAGLAATNLVLTGDATTNAVVVKSWLTDPTRTWPEAWTAVMAEAATFLDRFALPTGEAPWRAVWIWLLPLGIGLGCVRGRRSGVLGLVAVVGIALTLQSQYANVHHNRYQAPFLAMARAIGAAAVVQLVALIPERYLVVRRTALGAVVGVVALAAVANAAVWSGRFAADAHDIRRQHVAAGRWIGEHVQPGEVVALHDAGAMPYVSGHSRFVDLVGLTTEGFARSYRAGPGSLFERLESLNAVRRPDLYAVHPDWIGDLELFGTTRASFRLQETHIVSSRVLEIQEAGEPGFETGHEPWRRDATADRVVDAVDLADLASERRHGFDHGPRPGPTRYLRGPLPGGGRGADGARWIRGPAELRLRPAGAGPWRLVLRAAAEAPMEVAARWGDGGEARVELPGELGLRDWELGEVPADAEGPLRVELEPAGEGGFFAARAYLVSRAEADGPES